MKIEIDGEEILNIDDISNTALEWRLLDPKEWIKNAIIGQISHAKGEMIKFETNRVRGKEEGMPASLGEDDLVCWLAKQPGFQNAKQKKAEQEAK